MYIGCDWYVYSSSNHTISRIIWHSMRASNTASNVRVAISANTRNSVFRLFHPEIVGTTRTSRHPMTTLSWDSFVFWPKSPNLRHPGDLMPVWVYTRHGFSAKSNQSTTQKPFCSGLSTLPESVHICMCADAGNISSWPEEFCTSAVAHHLSSKIAQGEFCVRVWPHFTPVIHMVNRTRALPQQGITTHPRKAKLRYYKHLDYSRNRKVNCIGWYMSQESRWSIRRRLIGMI